MKHQFKLNPFPYSLLTLIGRDEVETMQDHGCPIDLEQFDGKCGLTSKSEAIIVLWIERPAIGLLIHETIHAVTVLFDRCDVPISYINDEILAYMVQHIVGEVLDKFWEYFNIGPDPIDLKKELYKAANLLTANGFFITRGEQTEKNYNEKVLSEKEEKINVFDASNLAGGWDINKFPGITELIPNYPKTIQILRKEIESYKDVIDKQNFNINTLKETISKLGTFPDNVEEMSTNELKKALILTETTVKNLMQFRANDKIIINKLKEENTKLKKEIEDSKPNIVNITPKIDRLTTEKLAADSKNLTPSENPLNQFSEQSVIIYCNRFYEIQERFPTIKEIDLIALSNINDYIKGDESEGLTFIIYGLLGVSKNENHSVLNLRITRLSLIAVDAVQSYIDKLRGIENREGGC